MLAIAVLGVAVATAVVRAIVVDHVRAATPPRVVAPAFDLVLERREVVDPRGPITLLRYGDGRVAATCQVTTELEGGPHLRTTGARVLTRDRAFDRVWRVRRGAGCCTMEVRREILGSRPLSVSVSGGTLVISGSGAWCREGALVEAARSLRAVLPRTELEGLRVSAVDDPVPNVRIPAWVALLAVDERAARRAMTSGLGSGHPRIRMEAARRLGNDSVLLQLVADPVADAEIRKTALRSLSDPGALVSAIDVALASDDDELRRLALAGLGTLEGSRPLQTALQPWIDGTSSDWSPECQEVHASVTARLLRGLRRRELSEPVLLRFLAFGELRELALRGLAERGTAAVVTRLRLLQHLDPGGAQELELVVDAIRQRLGGVGALALADPTGGGLSFADPGAGGALALDEP